MRRTSDLSVEFLNSQHSSRSHQQRFKNVFELHDADCIRLLNGEWTAVQAFKIEALGSAASIEKPTWVRGK
jgi:hypothetical protein